MKCQVYYVLEEQHLVFMIMEMQMVFPSVLTSDVIKPYKIFVTAFVNLFKIGS